MYGLSACWLSLSGSVRLSVQQEKGVWPECLLAQSVRFCEALQFSRKIVYGLSACLFSLLGSVRLSVQQEKGVWLELVSLLAVVAAAATAATTRTTTSVCH